MRGDWLYLATRKDGWTVTVEIDVRHAGSKATLILEFGPGTEEPSVMIENYSRDAILLGEIRRSDEAKP